MLCRCAELAMNALWSAVTDGPRPTFSPMTVQFLIVRLSVLLCQIVPREAIDALCPRATEVSSEDTLSPRRPCEARAELSLARNEYSVVLAEAAGAVMTPRASVPPTVATAARAATPRRAERARAGVDGAVLLDGTVLVRAGDMWHPL